MLGDFSATTLVTLTYSSVGEFECSATVAGITLAADFTAGTAYNLSANTLVELSGEFIQASAFDLSATTKASLSAAFTAGKAFDCSITTAATLDASFFAGGELYEASITTAPAILEARFSASLAAVYATYVVNTKTLGPAEYTNYSFNSYFCFNGEFYGCSSTGIVKLSGKDDLGTDIDATATSGISNLGNRNMKLFPYVYVTGRNEGEYEVAITLDEITSITYPVTVKKGRQGVHTKRGKFGKNTKGSSVQITVQNVDGSDIDLQQVDLPYVILSRSK